MRRAARFALAWAMLVGGLVGSVLSALGLVAKDEPAFVLQLSWAAVWSQGLVALLVVDVGGS